MSLKAKIEAVIYASEEPVTLAQLAGLLGQEVQGELDRIAARQHHLHLATADDLPATPDADPETSQDATRQPAEAEPAPPELATDPNPTPEPDSAAEKKHAREQERRIREFLAETIQSLLNDYANSDRGLEIREVAGGFRMATRPEYHDAVRGFVRSLKPPLKLSPQALETLAVVAYKQPVTAPEVSEIRGVESAGVLGSLIARKLIATAGRKQVVGRPILYKTTKDFLLRFGLKDTSDLPSIEEFEKMAGELAEQEEIPMSDPQEVAEQQKRAAEPQADGDTRSLTSTPTNDMADGDSNLPQGELPAVDGRLSGLPPTYSEPGDNPSADEAAIQSEDK